MDPITLSLAAGSALAGIFGGSKARKAASKAADEAMRNQKTVDIGKLVADARANSEANLAKSLELERKFLPGTAQLRESTTANLESQLTGEGKIRREDALNQLLGFTPSSAALAYEGSPLFKAAADKAAADLALGGNLDPETQAAVVRGALSGAGRSGVIGSEAGRGLTARDLGLTSLALSQSRQKAALEAGDLQSRLGLSAGDQLLRALGMGVEATGSNLSQAGQLFNLLANQALPESGLSSGSLADIEIGQTNAYNQRLMDAAGIKAGGAISGIGQAVGGIQQGLGLFAGSLPKKTAAGTSKLFDFKINPTTADLFGSAGYSNLASKYPLGLYTGMVNPLGGR
jgi:hypothetical protein